MARALRYLLLGLVAWLAASGPAWAADASERQVLMLLRLAPEHSRAEAAYAGSYGSGAARKARQRIATRVAREHGLVLAASWPMPLVGLDCFVVNVPADRSPAEAAAQLSVDPAVAWSEPMHVYRAEGEAPVPNDPLFRVQPAAREWRLAELHELATGRNVRVAVVDSAIDARHPDLAGQFQTRRNFVPDRADAAELHGTGVAGVIAALADNGVGVVGVAPGARLMALRACWQQEASETLCNTLSLAEALHFAIEHNAQVGKLIDVAVARGIVVVGAVDPNLAGGGFPASHRGVVAVSMSAAPGRDVPTTQPGARWALVSGSSYSAAHVSGLAALLRESNPRARGPMTLVSAQAGGAIDACATLLRGAATCGDCACAPMRSATPAPAR
jgi:hypothetical protein